MYRVSLWCSQAASDAFDLGYTVAQYIYDNLDRVVYGQQSPPRW